MNKSLRVGTILIILCLIPLGQMFLLKWHHETTYHDIYCATLPFGFIYLEGEIGGWFLGFSGQIGMVENYNIKYMDNGQLKTIIFDAEDMPLIVDGAFQVEKTVYWKTYYTYFWKCREEAPWLTEYKIHIPYLPDINQTLTENWIR